MIFFCVIAILCILKIIFRFEFEYITNNKTLMLVYISLNEEIKKVPIISFK